MAYELLQQITEVKVGIDDTLDELQKSQRVNLTSGQKKRLIKTFGELAKAAAGAQTATQKEDGKSLTLALRTMKIGMKLITQIIKDKSS